MPGLDPGIHRAAGTMDPRITLGLDPRAAGDAERMGMLSAGERPRHLLRSCFSFGPCSGLLAMMLSQPT
jgi:hypothetical protein